MKRLLPLLLLLLLLPACGRRSAPVAPELLRKPPVSGLAVMQRGELLEISWSSPAAGEVTRFRLLRRQVLPPGQDCEECIGAYVSVADGEREAPAGTAGSSYTVLDRGLTPGTGYQYRVQALDRDGLPVTASKPVRRTLRQLPPAPAVSAELTPVSIILSWEPLPQPAGADGPIRYQVHRRQAGDPAPAVPLIRRPLAEARYEDFPPARGVAYLYSVRGIVTVNNEAAETAPSTEVTVTVPLELP
jgi:hypothetical protein